MCLLKWAFGEAEADGITREDRLVEADKKFTNKIINKILISSSIDY